MQYIKNGQDCQVSIVDIKPKLFTPMMTTKSKGQGFGLAVVKRMSEGFRWNSNL